MQTIKIMAGLKADLVALSGQYVARKQYFTTDTKEYFVAINSTTLATFTDKTAVQELIATAKQETKDELINGAPATYDTLKEISDFLETNPGEVTQAITDAIVAAKEELRGEVSAALDTFEEVEVKIGDLETLITDSLAEAKSYADTAAGTAETNAKAHADTVAGEAETNANTYTDDAIANITIDCGTF